MRTKAIILTLLAGAAIQLFTACERRPLEDTYAESALIPVKIDWSVSNIPVSDPSGSGYVHRVSLRFYPKDGSAPFDRYLETNVIEGQIEVPIGEYSVIVFNEAVGDVYWEDAVTFSDADSYENFAATLVADDAANYPFYKPLLGEDLRVEPLRLASWSLDDFSVTEDMVKITRYGTGTPTGSTIREINALTVVKMRALTYTVNVTVHVENLVSAQLIQGAVRGFAQKVYMASAQTVQIPVTHVFRLNSRRWDDAAQIHGTVSKSFLSFGRLPQASDYWLNLDVLYGTGVLHPDPLLYDVSDQVNDSPQISINIDIGVDIRIPYIEGGIGVGDWDDETIIIQ